MQNRFGLILSLALIISFPAKPQEIENSLFWEISGNGIKSSSFLFGTYHLLNYGYLEEVPKVKKAFEQASGVVVEAIIDSTKMMEYSLKSLMQDTTLSDLLSSEEQKLIATELKETMGISYEVISQLKPMALALNLIVIYTQKRHANVLSRYKGYSMDVYFGSMAKQKNIPVQTFETIEQQIDILYNHNSLEEQAKYLIQIIQDKESLMAEVDSMTTFYFDQDLKSLLELNKDQEVKYGDMKYMLDDRNTNWMKKFPEFLNQGNEFIAVGALHLAGENGLVSLLRKAGYTVKPISTK